MFLLIGGEKRGITRSFLDQADVKLEIPYGRSFAQSLGAAASTAVIAFEMFRQRQPDNLIT
jgi:23S rRNA (guanosine2251-2'-O)-methyltransferase